MNVPSSEELSAAWLGLAPPLRDHIGRIALEMVFQSFLSGAAYAPADRVLQDDEARAEAGDVASRRLSELHTVIEHVLPDLFGPESENPAWAMGDTP